MKLFGEDILSEACRKEHIENLSGINIGEMVRLAQYLEKNTGIPFVRMDQGSPGLDINSYGVQAEKEALDRGEGSQYPAPGGIPELQNAASRFVKAFLDVDISPRSCIATTGSVAASFGSFIACAQKTPGKDKVLFIDPGFPIQKSQLKIIGIGYRTFDIYSYRGAEKIEKKLREELSGSDVCAIVYSNPNNPSWFCLEAEELEVIGRLATEYDAVVMEDLAYFCMDYRRDLGHPFKEPYFSTVAKYTDNYILLLSASKIFSYAGQRIALCCISDSLYEKQYPELAKRYCDSGVFGVTLVTSILYMLTSGCTTSTQYGYAKMLELSCEGVIDFIEDTRFYERMARKVKDIFCSNGFRIVYEDDVTDKIGDGFFFSLGYGDMTSGELLTEMIAYGMSAISLLTTGSRQDGVRICVSRMKEEQLPVLEERARMFDIDHRK